ncbi:MAG TPA: putative quinol monooxygenase [Burkholderiales bacterium]|nr:putative quinol monooxygenase [Burkholderiales bacterium]
MSGYALIVHLQVKPENLERFMEMALENAAATRSTEPGCRQFDVLVAPEEPTRIAFYEVYDNETAFEAHQQTGHFQKYLQNAVPLLATRKRTFFTRTAP